uniref:Uncharacterized protein n=1 Tax=virus sp. ctML55 TaxID=2827627 RepID=A0A8S5RH60_9VIRU|nr:MAG TPA: hypothetical protein [virus sp. ctML55]DAH11993.1 MAG TPA: hypothetical protein [Caudoviricetes sp.]
MVCHLVDNILLMNILDIQYYYLHRWFHITKSKDFL